VQIENDRFVESGESIDRRKRAVHADAPFRVGT
jgi:hypothetical protein